MSKTFMSVSLNLVSGDVKVNFNPRPDYENNEAAAELRSHLKESAGFEWDKAMYVWKGNRELAYMFKDDR